MEPLILVLIVVVIVVIAVLVMRKKPALPSSTEVEQKPKAVTAESKVEPKAEKPAAEAPKAEQAAKAEKAEKPAEAAAPAAAEAAPAVKAEAEPIAPAVQPAPEPERPSLPELGAKAPNEDLLALKKGLGATRGGFFARLKDLFARKPELDESALTEVEEILLSSDVGVTTTQSMLATLRDRFAKGQLASSDALQAALRAEAIELLDRGAGAIALRNKPTVLLFVGVNGVGKTTTIGKLASKYKDEGKKVLLAAGDTYRAAAVIQLEAWGRRVGCDVIKGKDRADPSGVIFDAVKKGVDEGYDVVLCDTAGRLQTKTPLMDELAKIGRSVEKALGRPTDETLLVLDATTGQNAIAQAQQFGATLGLSGIVLTKLDGTAKGGVILGIVDQHKVPVRYVGIGERVEDLRPFDAKNFVEALFDPGEDQ